MLTLNLPAQDKAIVVLKHWMNQMKKPAIMNHEIIIYTINPKLFHTLVANKKFYREFLLDSELEGNDLFELKMSCM